MSRGPRGETWKNYVSFGSLCRTISMHGNTSWFVRSSASSKVANSALSDGSIVLIILIMSVLGLIYKKWQKRRGRNETEKIPVGKVNPPR